ncbi:MAG: hypothetical protein WC647_07330 [Desulfomonilaceae bacterium]
MAVPPGIVAEENNGAKAQESVDRDSFRRRIKKNPELNGVSVGNEFDVPCLRPYAIVIIVLFRGCLTVRILWVSVNNPRSLAASLYSSSDLSVQ